MAGVFNPSISEAGMGAARTIIPDSIGSIAAGTLDSIGGILRSSQSGGPSEFDKKNTALQPIAEEFDKIAQNRASGAISPTQAEAQTNALISSSLQAFPALRSEILGVGGALLQEDLEDIPVDALAERRNVVNQFLIDDPDGQAAMPSIVARAKNADGSTNNELFQALAEEEVAKITGRRASATRLKMQLENQTTTAALEAPRFMADQDQVATQNLLGIVGNLLSGDITAEDLGATNFTDLISQVAVAKERAILLAEAEASQAGLLGSSVYNTNAIAARFDGAAAFLKVLADAPGAEAKALRDKSTFALTKSLLDNGFPANEQTFEQMAIYLRGTNQAGFAKAIKRFGEIIKGEQTPLAIATSDPGKAILDDNGVVPDNIVDISRGMTVNERRAMVKGAAASVALYAEQGDPSDPVLRSSVIRDYGKVVAALAGSSEPAGPSTFNTIYTKDFVQTYNKILLEDTPETRGFQNAVVNSLSEIDGVAIVRLENEVKNRFSKDFVSFEVARKGNSMDVILGEPVSEKAQFIRDFLKKEGLEFTVNNIKQRFLSSRQVFTNEPAANTATERLARAFAKEVVGATAPGIGYLNQVQDFTKQLPGLEPLVAQEPGTQIDLSSKTPEVPMNDDVEKVLFPFIQEHEGLRQTAYQDTGGVWTIGYGHTGPDVQEGMVISETKANELYAKDSATARKAVETAVAGLGLKPQQIAALTSFVYNIGVSAFRKSTLLAKLKAKDTSGAVEEFGRWVYDDGKRIKGLENRRAAEAKLFQTASIESEEEN